MAKHVWYIYSSTSETELKEPVWEYSLHNISVDEVKRELKKDKKKIDENIYLFPVLEI